MGYPLATVTLAPWLYFQGNRVRRNTPQLTEAAGERSGTVGNGSPLKLLIVGDSAAAGVGVSHQSQALSGKLVDELKQSHKLTWRLIAKTGRKLSHVLHQIEIAEGDNYDIVVISVGVNDVTAGTSPRLWRRQLLQLLNLIDVRFSPTQIILPMIPPMDRFPALPQPLRWYMGLRTRRLNTVSQNLIANHSSRIFLDINLPLTPDFMAADGFHPNQAANQLWASHIIATIKQSPPITKVQKRLAACAIFVRDGRVLLGHRSPNLNYYPDVWDLIGGHVKSHETPEQALRREAEEEIGCIPSHYRFLRSAQEPNPEQHGPGEFYFFVVTAWKGPEPQIRNREHDRLKWFTLDEVHQIKLADSAYLEILANIDELKSN